MNTLLNLGGQLDYMGRPPQEQLLEMVRLAFFFAAYQSNSLAYLQS
jgi:hypothetical protein